MPRPLATCFASPTNGHVSSIPVSSFRDFDGLHAVPPGLIPAGCAAALHSAGGSATSVAGADNNGDIRESRGEALIAPGFTTPIWGVSIAGQPVTTSRQTTLARKRRR